MTAPQVVIDAYQALTSHIVRKSAMSPSEVENVQDSAERIAKAFGDMIWSREKILAELRKIFRVRFPTNTSDNQLVQQSHIQTVSLCPHHFLPVEAVVHYGYVSEPGSQVIGLSKFVRIAQTLAKRAVIQEQLTQDLADVMTKGTVGECMAIDPSSSGQLDDIAGEPFKVGPPVSLHVGVVINASHGCMSCRGVMSPSRTHTSLFTGLMSAPTWKSDFYKGIEETRALI